VKRTALEPAAKALYEQDFFEWTVLNAGLLRAGRLQEADLEHISEEIEDMGKSERHELRGRMRVLLSHLLKWKYQPDRRSRSWKATIRIQREETVHLLQQMPSLRGYLQNQLRQVYAVAVEGAIAETDLTDEVFPPACPFSIDQILDTEFFPE
jgi:hypothetical protein